VDPQERRVPLEPKATKVTPEQLGLLAQLVPLAQRALLVLTAQLDLPVLPEPLVPLVLPVLPVLPVKTGAEL